MTADVAARKWADYMRLRRRPTKACRTCQHVYPNTLDHFAAGMRGRVGVRCHLCVAAHPVPTRLKQTCPCCGDFTRLVRDRNAPGPVAVFMCISCLRVINGMLSMSDRTRTHVSQYMHWRESRILSQQAQVRHSSTSAQNAGTLPEVPAVAEISSNEASREPPD